MYFISFWGRFGLFSGANLLLVSRWVIFDLFLFCVVFNQERVDQSKQIMQKMAMVRGLMESPWKELDGTNKTRLRCKKIYIQDTNSISHLEKRKIIFNSTLVRDMLVPRRVHIMKRIYIFLWYIP